MKKFDDGSKARIYINLVEDGSEYNRSGFSIIPSQAFLHAQWFFFEPNTSCLLSSSDWHLALLRPLQVLKSNLPKNSTSSTALKTPRSKAYPTPKIGNGRMHTQTASRTQGQGKSNIIINHDNLHWSYIMTYWSAERQLAWVWLSPPLIIPCSQEALASQVLYQSAEIHATVIHAA